MFRFSESEHLKAVLAYCVITQCDGGSNIASAVDSIRISICCLSFLVVNGMSTVDKSPGL